MEVENHPIHERRIYWRYTQFSTEPWLREEGSFFFGTLGMVQDSWCIPFRLRRDFVVAEKPFSQASHRYGTAKSNHCSIPHITARYRKHFVSSQHLTAAYIHSKVPLLGDKCDKHLKTLYFERWPKKSLNPGVSPVHALQQKVPWSHSSRQKGLETWAKSWSRFLQQEMKNSSSWSSSVKNSSVKNSAWNQQPFLSKWPPF